MTLRTPIVLLALVLALGVYVFFFERDRPGRAEIEARDGFLLPSFIRERVTGFTVGSGPDAFSLSREGEGFDETWTFDGQDAREADPDAVEDYLRNWEFAMPTRTLENPSDEDVVAFGLGTPRAAVRFGVGRAEIVVTLGSGKPVDGGGYLRIDQRDQTVVVPADVVELFDATAERFRIKNDGGRPTLEDLDIEPVEGARVIDASVDPAEGAGSAR